MGKLYKTTFCWEEFIEEPELPILKTTIHCIGDCLTAGLWVAEDKSYPSMLKDRMGDNFRVRNYGRTMLRLSHLASYKDLFTEHIKNPDDIVIIWAGTNDLFTGGSAKTALENLAEFYEVVREKTSNIFIATIIKRIAHASYPNFEKERFLFNRTLSPVFDDKVINLDNISVTRNYKKDKTHLSEKGYYKVADYIYKCLTKT